MKVSIGRRNKKTSEQKVSVRIDPWDTYCCDTTIATIAVPLLKSFKEHRKKISGVPSTFLPDDYDGSETSLAVGEARFVEVINRIEWSLEQIATDYKDEPTTEVGYDDSEFKAKNQEYYTRVQEGLDLFGKYLTTLWW